MLSLTRKVKKAISRDYLHQRLSYLFAVVMTFWRWKGAYYYRALIQRDVLAATGRCLVSGPEKTVIGTPSVICASR